MTARRSERGFALLDALVALAIVGVLAGMFTQVVQTSVLVRRHAALSREAVLLARSRLDLAQAGNDLSQSGHEGALSWRLTIEPYPGAANGPGLEQLTLLVSDAVGGRPVVALKTLRLAR